jgi:hypothetical protein|tara:strand:- start:11 stop:472 length:462 start_codon:yes stop_codon:yes gene_type:complete
MKLEDVQDIIVGGLVIEVNSPNMDLINNGLLGHYLPACLEIGIRDDVPLQLQGNILVHETIHAIANVYCEGLSLDEAQVAGIAQGLYQVLTDNEDFVRFVTQSDHKEDALAERSVNTIMDAHVRTPSDDLARSTAVAAANGHTAVLGHEYDDH